MTWGIDRITLRMSDFGERITESEVLENKGLVKKIV
jgi:hypothetical protein